jgi:hypothetical protein
MYPYQYGLSSDDFLDYTKTDHFIREAFLVKSDDEAQGTNMRKFDRYRTKLDTLIARKKTHSAWLELPEAPHFFQTLFRRGSRPETLDIHEPMLLHAAGRRGGPLIAEYIPEPYQSILVLNILGVISRAKLPIPNLRWVAGTLWFP